MRRPLRILAAAVTIGLFAASVASAQSRPYGGDDQFSPGAQPQYAASSQNGSSYIYNYPAAEIQAVPPARAAAAVARAVENRETSMLHGAVRTHVRTFENSDDLKKAVAAEQDAYAEYVKARHAALRDLRNDEKYQAQVQLANSLKQKIADRHAEAKGEKDAIEANRADIAAMATVRFDYASQVKARENEALAKNNAVQDARRNLMEARQRVSQLRGKLDDQVRNDDNIVAARKSFWDAKINRLGAEAYLRGTLEARYIALRYVYDVNKYNKYGQGYQYAGGYPYSCGYGFGYTMNPYVPR